MAQLSKHNFNVVMQDANGVKYRNVVSTQNTNHIIDDTFILDADGEPQNFVPVAPVTFLFIEP